MLEELKKVKYRIRSYDTYYQNFLGINHVGEYTEENAAIDVAMVLLEMMYQPSDLVEIQIYTEGIGCGEWIPIIAVHFIGADNWEDTEIVAEYIYS